MSRLAQNGACRDLAPSEIARLGDSDAIPETSDDAWATAVRGRHAKAMEAAISIRLDAEVMAWLRRKGPSYGTEINRILREKMLRRSPTFIAPFVRSLLA
jgi:uncharacterized protein (DUF4415 family)